MAQVIDLKNHEVELAKKILSPKARCKFTVGLVDLKPGECVGEHSIKDHEEVVYVMSGEGAIITTYNTTYVKEGNLIHVQSRQKHDVKNISNKKNLKYLFIVS